MIKTAFALLKKEFIAIFIFRGHRGGFSINDNAWIPFHPSIVLLKYSDVHK